MLIPLNQITEGLSDSMYMIVMEDDIGGDIFFGALEQIDSSLDVINTVDVGDYIFSFEDPSQLYSFSDEGSSAQHGEHIYCTTTGAERKVFISKSEDDGTLPHNHAYWQSYFSNQNVSCHIYQSMTDILAQYNTNIKDLKEIIAPIQSRVQAPSKIDHAVIRSFFAWMPVEQICKTFEKTTQFMCMLSSTILLVT